MGDILSLTVILPSGKRWTVHARRGATVGKLKSRIQDQEGIPLKQQRLLACGQQLDDRRSMGYYLDDGLEIDIIDVVLGIQGC